MWSDILFNKSEQIIVGSAVVYFKGKVLKMWSIQEKLGEGFVF